MINPKVFEESLKKVLGKTRSQCFSQGLFDSVDWFPFLLDNDQPSMTEKNSESLINLKKDIKEFISKTTLVPQNKYIEKKIDTNNNKVDFAIQNRLSNNEYLKKLLELGIDNKKIFLKNFSNESEIKIIFISDEFIIKENTQSSLEAISSNKSHELFKKMIEAMRLKEENYFITGLNLEISENKIDCFDLVLNEILSTKPKLIISLGAISTQKLLNRTEHFTELRSKLYDISFGNDEDIFETKLMPLFHPDLLKINNNLKNLAWKDMQMAMEYLQL